MAANGLMTNAKSYPLMIDTRVDSSAGAMIVISRRARLTPAFYGDRWQAFMPAGKPAAPCHTSLVKEMAGPRLVFRIGMGVRPADQNWKRLLNRVIQENQPAINKILLDFGVPLLDEDDRADRRETATKSP